MNKTAPVLLIVDKEEQPNPNILPYIKEQGVHCVHVKTAAECLKAVIEKKVTLVVVDESLPDLSGLTLVALLKKMKPDLEIIFTTPCHDPQKEIDARLAGILYYAVQPCDWAIMGQIIERALSKQSKRILLNQH